MCKSGLNVAIGNGGRSSALMSVGERVFNLRRTEGMRVHRRVQYNDCGGWVYLLTELHNQEMESRRMG
jgi:hypothetical protein